jgi:hypothetical protein
VGSRVVHRPRCTCLHRRRASTLSFPFDKLAPLAAYGEGYLSPGTHCRYIAYQRMALGGTLTEDSGVQGPLPRVPAVNRLIPDGANPRRRWVATGYCLSPLLMHSLCMQHQVTWCAPLAAIDNTEKGPSIRVIKHCQSPLMMPHRMTRWWIQCCASPAAKHRAGFTSMKKLIKLANTIPPPPQRSPPRMTRALAALESDTSFWPALDSAISRLVQPDAVPAVRSAFMKVRAGPSCQSQLSMVMMMMMKMMTPSDLVPYT